TLDGGLLGYDDVAERLRLLDRRLDRGPHVVLIVRVFADHERQGEAFQADGAEPPGGVEQPGRAVGGPKVARAGRVLEQWQVPPEGELSELHLLLVRPADEADGVEELVKLELIIPRILGLQRRQDGKPLALTPPADAVDLLAQ